MSSGDTNGLFGVSVDFLVLDGGGGGGGVTTDEPVDGLAGFVGAGVVVSVGVVVVGDVTGLVVVVGG